MPIEYPAASGGGVINEHTAVRENVGIFDVSHLGKARVTGPGALEFLNSLLTNDLTRIVDGQAQYTMLCDDASGGVVDDLIAYRISTDEIFLIPNAANTTEVVRRISASAPSTITVSNCHEDYGVIAIQGPNSRELLTSLGISLDLDYMSFTTGIIEGSEVIICRTGYTGEWGYEVLPKWDDAMKVWRALVTAVEERGGRVAGLGARDTLRTEMCYPLHGHELSLSITPVEASASWAVGWKKDKFEGKDRLVAQRSEGAPRKSVPLLLTDRGIPRADMKIFSHDGGEIGVVTSGTFSPTLKVGIALALIEPRFVEGDEVFIDIRGKRTPAIIKKAPLVPSRVK